MDKIKFIYNVKQFKLLRTRILPKITSLITYIILVTMYSNYVFNVIMYSMYSNSVLIVNN